MNGAMRFEDCHAGVRVVVWTGKHREKHGTIHRPIAKMVAVMLDGENSTRNLKPNSLVLEEHWPNRPEEPSPPPRPGRGFFRRTQRTEADNDPDTEPTVPTPDGRRVHTRLQRAMLEQAYENDDDFSQRIDGMTQALVDLHFGSSAPVLEFVRDRLELAEEAALARRTPA